MPNENKETRMKKFLALAACGALALGVAACGSSSKSSNSGPTRRISNSRTMCDPRMHGW